MANRLRSLNIFMRMRLVAIALCLLFLIGGVALVHHMIKQNEVEVIDFLWDSVRQNKTSVTTRISGDFQTLDGVAICLSQMDMHDTATMRLVLMQINQRNTFFFMGLADLSGNIDLLDIDGKIHERRNIAGTDYYQTALKGEFALSKTFYDAASEKYLNSYAVPVLQNGRVAAVLCAYIPADVFQEIIDTSFFNGRGYCNIIEQDGDYVIRSGHPEASEATSLLQLGEFSHEQYEQVQELLANGQADMFTCDSPSGVALMVVFEPLGINNWYVMNVTPKNMTSQRYNRAAIGVSGILTTALLIFLFLIFLIRRITDKSRATLEEIAYVDALTGGRSYPKFLLDVERMRAEGQQLSLWYCDIKNFKFINELLGYDSGDQILSDFYEVLKEMLGEQAVFCRSSADNFVGVIDCDDEELVCLLERFVLKLPKFEASRENRFHIDVSIGVCRAREGRNLPLNDMVNRAMMAQREAKTLSGSNYAFYSEKMRKTALYDTELETTMKTAMENGEFKVYFQPKVDVQNNFCIDSVEALSRWESKDGFVTPDRFIPLFEKNGFITQLDRHIFTECCRWIKKRIDAGQAQIPVAVNVSRVNLLQPDFLTYYTQTKAQYQIPNGLLELEVTESVILDDKETFRQIVLQLRENGFTCSLDDFGNGYSSLNILKNLPIDVLKLDFLFFHDGVDFERERIVIASVLDMAGRLSMRTVAEGVEEWTQVVFLRENGCNLVQGYVFARPMPIEEFDRLLERVGDGPINE